MLMKKNYLIIICLSFAAIISCKKNSPSPAAPLIEGKWNHIFDIALYSTKKRNAPDFGEIPPYSYLLARDSLNYQPTGFIDFNDDGTFNSNSATQLWGSNTGTYSVKEDTLYIKAANSAYTDTSVITKLTVDSLTINWRTHASYQNVGIPLLYEKITVLTK
jgi:hypothetical protein